MTIKQSVLICFGIALALMTAGTAAAAEIYVPSDYSTIQGAVNNTTDGDTIIVSSGDYDENVVVSQSNITIRSQSGNPADTTVRDDSYDHVFNVTANNVTISGFRIESAPSNHAGIYLEGSNNTVSNNKLWENGYGIYLYDSSYNNLTDNSASNSDDYGIYLNDCSYNNLTDNSASENNEYGIYLANSDYNNLTDNSASGGYDYQNTGIYLSHSDENDLISNTASKNDYYGIRIYNSDNNILISNTASKNDYYGISVDESENNILANNTASNNDYYHIGDNCGIWLKESYNNTLIGNTASYNDDYGIYLNDNSDENDLINNTVKYNDYGIYLYDSSDENDLINNTVKYNDYGIYLSGSDDNLIYNNYFNNTNNVRDGGNNRWNTTITEGTNIIVGPNLGGNYWSDYTGIDTDGDGFGNSFLPHNSSGNIRLGGDYLPLVVPNSAPIANASGPYDVDENTTITFNASASSDPDGDALTYRWDFNNDSIWDTEWSSNLTANYTWDDDWIGEVKLEVNDSKTTTNDTTSVIVNNVAPVIEILDLPIASVTIDSTVNLSATFTDPGADYHTYGIDWDDTTTYLDISMPLGDRAVEANHTYANTGFYNVTLTVEDDDGGNDTQFRYVIVHDPDGGSVAGKGIFDSLAGTYYLDDSIIDEATFEFDSKYNKKGVPTGETQFMFKEADLEFQSESYYWLVVEGHKATFRGNGTVNDESGYEFLVSVIDGDDDLFRIKIWNSTDATDIIYDSNVGGDIDADPITEIEKGNIRIRT